MTTPYIDPNVIFASDAPANDRPNFGGDPKKGWDITRNNDGRPVIPQMNFVDNRADLKTLYIHEQGAGLPFKDGIDYADGALTLKDGELKEFDKVKGVWVIATGAKTDAELMTWSGRTQESRNKKFVYVDDYSSLQDAITLSARDGAILFCNPKDEYVISGLSIPDGALIKGRLNIRWNNNLSGLSKNYIVEIGKSNIDHISISTDGLVTNNAFVNTTAKDGIIKSITISQDNVNSNGVNAIKISHDGWDVGLVKSSNIQRPIICHGSEIGINPIPTFKLGFLIAINVVRGFGGNTVRNLFVGGVYITGRHPESSIKPGHNGVLLENVKNANVGDCVIEDVGEHAFRISNGSTFTSENIRVGNITAKRTGGCPFKANSIKGFNIKNVTTGNITGIDIGLGSPTTNQDLVRISHAENVTVGDIYSKCEEYEVSGANALTLNDVSKINIGDMYLDNISLSPIKLSDDQDGEAGPISDISIGNIYSNGTCPTLINFTTSQALSNIKVGESWLKEVTQGVLFFNKEPVTNGLVCIGNITVMSGISTVYKSTLNSDIKYSFTTPSRGFDASTLGGGLSGSFFGIFTKKTGQFSLSEIGRSFALFCSAIPPAMGAYGSAIDFCRPSGSRRGASIAVKQYGSGVSDVGLSFCADGLSTASDSVTEQMVVKRGTISMPTLKLFDDNSSAKNGGLEVGDIYKSPIGQLMIVY